MDKKSASAVALILAAACGWGIIGIFSRPLTAAGLNALQTTFLRSLITAAGLGLFILIKDRRLFRIRLRDGWMFLCLGLVSIVFFNICYFWTIDQATLSTASILLYTAPCFVMLLSALFFRERITLQKLTALVLAFVGCALISGSGEGIAPLTLLSGIGSGLGYASYSIFGKFALKKYHTFTVIFYTFLVAAAGLLPWANAVGAAHILSGSAAAAGNCLALGVISTVLPYICYTKGLERVEAGKASVLAFAEPLVAALSGIAVYHEFLGAPNIAGILLIFFALILLNIPIGKPRTKPPKNFRTSEDDFS